MPKQGSFLEAPYSKLRTPSWVRNNANTLESPLLLGKFASGIGNDPFSQLTPPLRAPRANKRLLSTANVEATKAESPDSPSQIILLRLTTYLTTNVYGHIRLPRGFDVHVVARGRSHSVAKPLQTITVAYQLNLGRRTRWNALGRITFVNRQYFPPVSPDIVKAKVSGHNMAS